MQDLNNDIDELFRKAADHYPLNTDSADFDALMIKMQQFVPPPASSNGRWNLFLYFILVSPLFFLAHIKISHKNFSPVSAIQHETGIKQLQNSFLPDIGFLQPAAAFRKQFKEDQINPFQVKPGKAIQLKTPAFLPGSEVIRSSEKQHNNLYSETTRASEFTYLENKSISSAIENQQAGTSVPTNETVENMNEISQPASEKNTIKPDSITKSAGGKKEPAERKDVPSFQKGLYAGIVAGVDFSTVKLQEINRVGYNAGVVVGYRISKRIAVESGAIWTKKNYYSDGKYFDDSKIPYTPGRTLLEVNGWCRMVEIPVTARYFFNVKGKNSWYLTAGLSSYLMNKESYSYLFEHNNYTYTTNKSYDNASQNWFSIINAGVGYERRWGKKTTVRVEPYLKVPVNGIGFGSLPVSSIGLNIGLTVGSSSKNK
jgi:hypothetical protein